MQLFNKKICALLNKTAETRQGICMHEQTFKFCELKLIIGAQPFDAQTYNVGICYATCKEGFKKRNAGKENLMDFNGLCLGVAFSMHRHI